MIKSVDHIDIGVQDIDASVDFFKKMGFQVVRQTEHGGAAVELQCPGSDDNPIIELHPVSDSRPQGIHHIAFKVDDINKTYESLLAQGLEFQSSPNYVPPTERWLASLFDPDGLKFQFVQVESK
tara:strand:+ start:6396 stop:6767 length:372 start_codon:yes stop_codon:yes gene_type:complete